MSRNYIKYQVSGIKYLDLTIKIGALYILNLDT